MSVRRQKAQFWSSQILHAATYCEFQNSWEVLLDNKLSLKDHIAAHLEPLTCSSSTTLRRRRKKTHGSILFNYSITQMETVITWELCTSLRAIECDLLSDGRELELIGSRCWCVQVIYTCASVGVFVHSRMSCTSFSQPHQTATTQPRFNNICCSCDVLSSAYKHGSRFLLSQ